MDNLPEGVLAHVLTFVGPGHFIHVAPVSRSFQVAYTRAIMYPSIDDDDEDGHPPVALPMNYSTTIKSVVASASRFQKFIDDGWLARLSSKFRGLICQNAARDGQLEVLKLARMHGCPRDGARTGAYMAAEHGHLEILQWAHANGCRWDESTCSFAAMGGHLELLQWAHVNGCPWDESTCYRAAENGHLELLQWAHANGCPWDESTCSSAAENGHLELLQWARANGCPWDTWTFFMAALNGHLELLRWAHANGCP